MNESDKRNLEAAYQQALTGYEEGGAPIGAVMVKNGAVIAQGRNRRVQKGDPILHGETDCLKNAGNLADYDGIDLYTTLSPCMMCTGAILHFDIKRVVVGEDQNFPGNIELLRDNGVEVIVADNEECKTLMAKFIKERPDIWFEDIAGNEVI
jgi:cytosine/creatinine deaminase